MGDMAKPFRSRKKQTRLQFHSLPPTSSSKDEYDASIQDRLANVRYSGAKYDRATPEMSETSGLPTPEPSSATRARTPSPLSSPPSSPRLPLQRTPRPAIDDEEEDEDDIPLPSSKRRKVASTIGATMLASSPRRSTRLGGSSPLQSSHTKLLKTRDKAFAENNTLWSDIGSAETSGDDADEIITKPTIRRRSKPSEQEDDGFVVNDNQITEISSGEDAPVKAVRKPGRKNDIDDFMVDDDEIEYMTSEEDVGHTSSTRKKKKESSRRSSRRSQREQDELEEDLLDLQDSDHDDAAHRKRTRGGPVTTQRDQLKQHLARLKQSRAGKRVRRVIDSDEEEAEIAEESGSDGVDIAYITQAPRPYHQRSRSQSHTPSLIGAPELYPETFDNRLEDEDEDDDFIIQDTDLTIGSRPNRPNPDIPLQFTSFASAKPKELFIHIIEWMVKNKVSPAFLRDDDLYSLSFNRVDDQVKAQAGSRLISAAWNATFKYAILARPTMSVQALPGLDEDHVRTCDACNRTNHPARYDFGFTGTPYHKDNLEPLEPDDDDDADDDEDDNSSRSGSAKSSEFAEVTSHRSNRSYDSQGHVLARQSTHFYLGRYCAAAAEMGHKLTHWKHHLNTEVLSYLSAQGVLSAEEIVRRDKQSHKRREKEAENIVDAMQETGVIRELWERFQADLDDARFGMEGHESRGGKGRGKQRIGSVRVPGAEGRIGEWTEGGRYKEVAPMESDSDA